MNSGFYGDLIVRRLSATGRSGQLDERVFDPDAGNHLLRIQILGQDSHRASFDCGSDD
jgi:hypothetical protein